MSYFPHAYQKSFVAGTSSPLITNGTTASSALTAGKIALINASTNTSCDLSTSTSLSYTTVPLAYLAQGSFHTKDKMGPFHGGFQESVKSKGINPKYISSFTVSEPLDAIQDIQQIPVTAGCNILCNSTYRLRVDIKGSPALRFLTHNAYFTLDAFTGCCTTLGVNSTTGTDPIDPNVVLVQWADRINLYPTVKDFIKARVWNQVLVGSSGSKAGATGTAVTTAAASITLSEVGGVTAGNRVIFSPSYNGGTPSAATSTISGTTFTLGATSTVAFTVGQVITGTGVTAGTTITALLTGTGAASGSTFSVNISQTTSSATITGAAATGTKCTVGSIAGNTFTVTGVSSGLFSVGQVLTGTNVATGTTIVSRVSGGGGNGSVFTINICHPTTVTASGASPIATVSPTIAYVDSTYSATTGAGSVSLVAADKIDTPSTTAITAFTTTAITNANVKIYKQFAINSDNIINSFATTNFTAVTASDANGILDIKAINSFLEIVGAYVDTTFGDASFSPRDHVEYQPVELYSSISILDVLGNQCATTCIIPAEVQQAIQGRGFGETLVRELILSKRYQQEPWQQDPRLREVLDYSVANPAVSTPELLRANKYLIYNLLHAVPRKANPSGMMDNDQYMIRLYVPSSVGRLTLLEQNIGNWLTTANNYDTKFTVLP